MSSVSVHFKGSSNSFFCCLAYVLGHIADTFFAGSEQWRPTAWYTKLTVFLMVQLSQTDVDSGNDYEIDESFLKFPLYIIINVHNYCS